MEPESISLTTNLHVKLLRHTADMCRLWSSISPAQDLMTLQVNEASFIKELYTLRCGPVQGRWTSSQLKLPLLFRILKRNYFKSNNNQIRWSRGEDMSILNLGVSFCFPCWTTLSSSKYPHFSQLDTANSCGKSPCFPLAPCDGVCYVSTKYLSNTF